MITCFILGVVMGFVGMILLCLFLRGATLKASPDPPKVACWIRESAEHGIESVRVMEMEDVK